MANPPTDSTGPSNTVLKPEESVTILFHGDIPALHISTETPASLTCEEVELMCINHIQNFVCAQEAKPESHGANKYLPAFGLLALPEEKIWLPLNYVFKKNTADHQKYRFRVRFRPPSDKFNDGNVMCEYLFLQTLDDFLKGSLGKNTKLSTDTAFGLLKIALLFPKTLPLNSTQTVDKTFNSRSFYFWNFTKHLSKDLVKRFIHVPGIDHYWVCRALSTEINRYKGNIPPAQLGLFKREFYRLLMEAVPEYCFEVYEATEVQLSSNKEDHIVSAQIGIYKESGKLEALYYGEELLYSLRKIYSIKIGKPVHLIAPKWTVQIHAEGEKIKVLSFEEAGAAESFVSMIQGYFRLCICYDMYLCEELRTPSSRISSELKSFGPIRDGTAASYLQESKKTAEPGIGGFLIHESLDQVGIYHVRAWPKTDTHAGQNSRNTTNPGLIKCLTDMQFKLEMGEEKTIFDNSRQLRGHLTRKFGPQVLPSLKVFPVLADINDEYQEITIEPYEQPGSREDAQNTPMGLPVIRGDLQLLQKIPDKNPLIQKWEVDIHGEKMMLLELQSDQGIHQAAFREGLMRLQKLYRIKKASFLKFYSTVLDVKFSVLMEFTPHQDVLTYICNNPQTVKQKVDIMDQIINILIVMEKESLYHGNLRLRKFMAFNSQEPGLVKIKLGDPGIVSHFDTLALEDSNNTERFPWLSPERRNNLTNITYHSEVYALGTTLYELLCQSDQFHEVLKLRAIEDVQKYLEQNKHFPRPPLLDDNSREPLSEVDEGNKLLSEALAVVMMMWEIIQKCWSDDVADRPSPQTLLNDVTVVREKASTIEADTVIDEMKQVAYDIGVEHEAMKTDDNKKLTVREIEDRLRNYLRKYYLDKNCLDTQDYATKLGTGYFGAVYEGKMRSPEKRLDGRGQRSAEDWTLVAIKRMKNCPEKGCRIDRRIVYKEIKVAVELDHPNVVKLLHLCTDCSKKEYDPVMMIMEYMNLGSLTKYAGRYGELSDAKRVSHMLKILRDVAEGMVYLAGKEIVHRDLAARNVLLCGVEGRRVTGKVSDFGLARMMEGNYRFYKVNTQDVLPFFWMPPECFTYEGSDSKFSSKGDVWSFGIVMWEAFSKGSTPKKVLPRDITPEQLLEKYKTDWRLPGDKIKSNDAYNIMTRCWEMDPSKRPAFVELVQELKKLT
ncbi:hypothetical protein BsWGS_18534 [Bradybaena similaris]